MSYFIVKEKSKYTQTPYLEYFGNSNPYKRFLKSYYSSTSSMPFIKKIGKDWIANVGGVHGLKATPSQKSNFPIFCNGDFQNPIGTATIKEVFVDKSSILPIWHGTCPDASELLIIGIGTNQIPIRVTGNIKSVSSENQNQPFDYLEPQGVFLLSNKGKYELSIDDNSIQIFKTNNDCKDLIIGQNEINSKTQIWLNHQLHTISKWENILKLESPRNSKILNESIIFSFSYLDYNGKKNIYPTSINNDKSTSIQQIVIPYNENNGSISYKIQIKNQHINRDGLYFYLVHLDRSYQIKQKYENHIKPILKGGCATLYDSQKKLKGLGISDTYLNSIEDHFILISSETSLSCPYYFHQPGFGDDFGKIINNNDIQKMKNDKGSESRLKSNWTVKKLVVKLERM